MIKALRSRKAQGSIFGLPFSVIFSIVLIIFFIIIAFIVIKAFIKTQDCAKIGIFIDDFQAEVKNTWNSQKSRFEFKRNLPSNLEYVCFADLSETYAGGDLEKGVYENIGVYQGTGKNLFLYPKEKTCNMPHHNIKHLDIEKITSLKNPYCIAIRDGVVMIIIEKGFNDRLVRVS